MYICICGNESCPYRNIFVLSFDFVFFSYAIIIRNNHILNYQLVYLVEHVFIVSDYYYYYYYYLILLSHY